jgi:hypothetical protein
MENDKDFAFMVRGDPGRDMDGGRDGGRDGPNPMEIFENNDSNRDGQL